MTCDCGRCTLLAENVVPHYTQIQRVDAVHEPIPLGLFRLEGWERCDLLYLFTCRKCSQQSVSWPCSEGAPGMYNTLHFHCSRCDHWPYIVDTQDVYWAVGMEFPDPGDILRARSLACDLGKAICSTAAGSRP